MLDTFKNTLVKFETLIKEKLGVQNPALLKSSVLGVLANFLANIKHDTKFYYSKLFQEMNVSLCQDYNSMLFHSSFYNIDFSYVTPSVLPINIIVPELSINNITELEYIIPVNSTFQESTGQIFTIEEEIRIKLTTDYVSAYSHSDKKGYIKLIVTNTPNPNIPESIVYLVNYPGALQYEKDISVFNIPEYTIGESQEINLGVNDITNIKNIYVWVTENYDITTDELYNYHSDNVESLSGFTKMDIKFNKYGSSNSDETIFLNFNNNTITLKTGDGIYGKYIGGKRLFIEIQYSKGENVSISSTEFSINDIKLIEKTIINNKVSYKNVYYSTLKGISTVGNSGGKNITSIEDIRKKILNKISVRDNISSLNDFHNTFEHNGIKPFIDSKFINSKSFIYIFNALNFYNEVIDTVPLNVSEFDLMNSPRYPKFSYNGIDLISPFYYKNFNNNITDAYIINPEIYIDLDLTELVSNYVDIIDENDVFSIRQITLLISYDFLLEKSYIEILTTDDDINTYDLSSNIFNMVFEPNNYRQEISNNYTDSYCLLTQPLSNINVSISIENINEDKEAVTVNYSAGDATFSQLILKQRFFKYFEDLSLQKTITISDKTKDYTNNTYNNVLTNINTITDNNYDGGQEPILLRLPYLSYDFFSSYNPIETYNLINDYFLIDKYKNNINFNIEATQSFYNTIDIPTKFYDYIFKNSDMLGITPKLPINITLKINYQNIRSSGFQNQNDFELNFKMKIIELLKTKEGYQVNFYESEIEKKLMEEYPIIINIKFNSPKLFEVNSTDDLYKKLSEAITNDELLTEDLLEFTPPYFHYDYNNIVINYL